MIADVVLVFGSSAAVKDLIAALEPLDVARPPLLSAFASVAYQLRFAWHTRNTL